MSPARISWSARNDFEPRRLQRRRDELAVHAIEVDGLAVRAWLDPEWHGDEGMRADHCFLLLQERFLMW